jgi:hydroxymethylpyrimidine pyrophosphatase-like HAD family hydrolase
MGNFTYVAFDIDGTLIHTAHDSKNDDLNLGRAQLLILLSQMPSIRLVIWSGGGADYAKQQAKRFGLEEHAWRITSKFDHTLPPIDIAFDDTADFNMAKVNINVPFLEPKDKP